MANTIFRKFLLMVASATLLLLCTNGAALAGAIVDYEGLDTVHSGEKAPESGTRFTVGAGVAVVPDYEGSEDYEAAPLLHFRMAWANGRYLDFSGNRVKFNVMADSNWSIGPELRVRAKRDDDVDEKKVADLKTVDRAVELGGFVAYDLGSNFEVGANLLQDVADGHDGFLLGLSAGYRIPMDNTMIALKVFTTYASNDYMDAYFSVKRKNVGSSSLDFYNADEGFKDFGLTCVISHQFNGSWGMVGVLGYSRLIGDAADSPIVDDVGDANQFLGGIMGTYRF